MKGSLWSGFFCTFDTCEETNILRQILNNTMAKKEIESKPRKTPTYPASCASWALITESKLLFTKKSHTAE